MPVPQESNVGISSNPDPRTPSDPSTALTVPSNYNDPNSRNVAMNISGRTVVIYQRNKNLYTPAGGE